MGDIGIANVCVCGHHKSDHDSWGCQTRCKCMAPYGGDEAEIAKLGELIITNDGDD